MNKFKQKILEKFPKLTWWQIILILLAAGIAFSGFNINSKILSCEKTQPKLKEMKQ